MTHTPASGPALLVTTPPMSSGSIAGALPPPAGCWLAARIDAAKAHAAATPKSRLRARRDDVNCILILRIGRILPPRGLRTDGFLIEVLRAQRYTRAHGEP